MSATLSLTSRFRTPEGADRFLAAYDATLSLWKVPYEAVDVMTSFGMTHVNVAGSPESPPLVLIHGSQIASPVWYANIEPLSRHFRVYAPDVIDQMGRSVPTRRMKSPQDCADWLRELFDGLDLERAALGGHSHGGWQALNMAIRNPERVERLALLSPSGSFSRLRLQVMLHMLPVLVRPTRQMFYWSFQWLTTMPLGTEHPLPEQFMIGALSFNPQELSIGVVALFSDEMLRGLSMPTLLLIGEHDGTCRPKYDLERARRLIPQLEGALIEGGGHLFTVDRVEATNARLLKFLCA